MKEAAVDSNLVERFSTQTMKKDHSFLRFSWSFSVNFEAEFVVQCLGHLNLNLSNAWVICHLNQISFRTLVVFAFGDLVMVKSKLERNYRRRKSASERDDNLHLHTILALIA